MDSLPLLPGLDTTHTYHVTTSPDAPPLITDADNQPCSRDALEGLLCSVRECLASLDATQPIAANRNGFIYLIAGGEYYKIGKTSNVTRRYQNLGIKMPFKIELEHYVECCDMDVAESFMHQLFASKRRRGEWFDLTPEDVDFIRSFETIQEHQIKQLRGLIVCQLLQSINARLDEVLLLLEGAEFTEKEVSAMQKELQEVISRVDLINARLNHTD